MKRTKTNKLILIVGCPAAGKSTMSRMYADRHPMTLNLDIDSIWFMMGQWQESRPASHIQKMKLAYSLTRTHLQNGYDVVVSQDLERTEYFDKFEKIAEKLGAQLIEVMLVNEEDEALRRFIDRGKRSGHKTGFRPGGIVDTEGRELKVREMHRVALAVAKTRKNMYYIHVEEGEVEQTYLQLLKCIEI